MSRTYTTCSPYLGTIKGKSSLPKYEKIHFAKRKPQEKSSNGSQLFGGTCQKLATLVVDDHVLGEEAFYNGEIQFQKYVGIACTFLLLYHKCQSFSNSLLLSGRFVRNVSTFIAKMYKKLRKCTTFLSLESISTQLLSVERMLIVHKACWDHFSRNWIIYW